MSTKFRLVAVMITVALASTLASAQDQTSSSATTTAPVLPAATDQAVHHAPASPGTDMAQFCARVSPNGRFYPPEAFQRGVEGVATLECALDSNNGPETCWLLSEAPVGQHFGPAGLRLACLVRARGPMRDVSRAFQVEGDLRRHLLMPMHFRLAGN